MAFPHTVQAATLVALLSSGAAFAQDAGPHKLADAGPMIPPAAITAATAVPSASGGASLMGYKETISHFLHDHAVQPIVNLAQGSGDWVASGANATAQAARSAGQWLLEGTNAVASAAQGAGQWLTTGTDAVATAAHNTGAWIVSGSHAAIDTVHNAGQLVSTGTDTVATAAQNTGMWIASTTNATADAVQNAGQWVVSTSGAAAAATVGAASAAISGVLSLEDWSISLVKGVESHLRVNQEFQALMRESGFVMANVKVGLGVIPELDVEFRHERALSPEERAAFKAKVDAHVSKAPMPLSYFEKLLLRRLSKAGEMSEGMRISELHIDLVPLPGIQLFFDPLRFEEEQNKMIQDAYDFSKTGQKSLKSIEERVSKIEAMVLAPQARQ